MNVLVIGGVTVDILHLPGLSKPVTAPGGAGMYTALAAKYAGATATLFAQVPNPLPEILQPISQTLHWIGPEIPETELPRLEIAHYGGGKAALLHALWGAQAHLTPQALPMDLSEYRFIHLAVMVATARQLEFLGVCRERSHALISAGSNGKTAHGEPERVRELIRQTDLFFMNENEANAIFSSVEKARAEPGKRLFITLAERGVIVINGDSRTHVLSPSVNELDPTGAGDTFCGATLAGLARGLDPVSAAQVGVQLASEMIQGIGPKKLLK
jgi:ribokinase